MSNQNEFVCNRKDCPKREVCNMPTGRGKFDMDGRCSCTDCDWTGSTKPCEWVGDPYNIYGECLALK